ncbi:MAG: hypothetical protein AAF270_05900 [Pseudomonadota bacterium]
MSIDYGIEWAYGEFRIAKFKGDQIVQSWKSPTPVNDLASLSEAMHQATHHVDVSRGGSVAIAYEDDLHTHEFIEIPPLSRRDLNKYLQRHVETNKGFDGAAAWRAHPVDRAGVSGVLLHLMPKYVLDAVMRICEEFYLLPKLMVPLTEVMSEFVPSLEVETENALLLVALFDDRTQMLVSSDDGEILFVRELSYPWEPSSNERLIVDINRTIGYAKQRIGGAITQAWVIGENAEFANASLNERVDATMTFEPRAADPDFWLQQVVALPQGLASNFIPLLARSSITGKTFMRAGIMMAAVFALAAITISILVEGTILANRFDTLSAQQQISEKNDELLRLNNEVELMNLEKSKLDILSVDAFNLPALFLSHLGDLLPAGLVLTNAEIVRGRDGWNLTLRGMSDRSLGDVAPLLADFQKQLAQDPWNTAVTVSWEDAWMKQLEQGFATQTGNIGFEIRGQFR